MELEKLFGRNWPVLPHEGYVYLKRQYGAASPYHAVCVMWIYNDTGLANSASAEADGKTPVEAMAQCWERAAAMIKGRQDSGEWLPFLLRTWREV